MGSMIAAFMVAAAMMPTMISDPHVVTTASVGVAGYHGGRKKLFKALAIYLRSG